jgi:hypothetical protein
MDLTNLNAETPWSFSNMECIKDNDILETFAILDISYFIEKKKKKKLKYRTLRQK